MPQSSTEPPANGIRSIITYTMTVQINLTFGNAIVASVFFTIFEVHNTISVFQKF